MKIDLHGMTRDEALNFFIKTYNQCLKDNVKEIEVIHGFGSSGKGGIIRKYLLNYLKLSKEFLDFEVSPNIGMTKVLVKKSLPTYNIILIQDILELCLETPKTLTKIQGNSFKHFSEKEIKKTVLFLEKKQMLKAIIKGKNKTYLTNEEA